jgi:hypothetical protein
LKKWFYEQVTRGLARGIRQETKALVDGMYAVSKALDRAALETDKVVEGLHRRLLIHAGDVAGLRLRADDVVRVAREPGWRAKFLWSGAGDAAEVGRRLGQVLGERLDGVGNGSVEEQVARALRPAEVSPRDVRVEGAVVRVRLPRGRMGPAAGRGGANVKLAERLLGLRIRLQESA